MDATHIHLIVNHIPVFATFFSLLLLAWGLYRSNDSYLFLSFIGFILAAVAILITYESGEAAEEIVEQMSVIGHDVIERHEEAAGWAYWMTIILGIFGILGILFQRIQTSTMSYFYPLVFIFAMLTVGSQINTAYYGGLINHPELQPDFNPKSVQTPTIDNHETDTDTMRVDTVRHSTAENEEHSE